MNTNSQQEHNCENFLERSVSELKLNYQIQNRIRVQLRDGADVGPASFAELQEINRLHNELMHEAKMTLNKAIRIGELLVGEKAKLKHGGWLKWCNANLSFDQRTARRYIELFRNQAHLNSDSVTDLTSAYGMLSRKRKGLAEWEIKRLELDKLYDKLHKLRVATLTDCSPPALLTFEEKCELYWQRVHCAINGYFGVGGFESQERQTVWEFLARKVTERTNYRLAKRDNGEKLHAAG